MTAPTHFDNLKFNKSGKTTQNLVNKTQFNDIDEIPTPINRLEPSGPVPSVLLYAYHRSHTGF